METTYQQHVYVSQFCQLTQSRSILKQEVAPIDEVAAIAEFPGADDVANKNLPKAVNAWGSWYLRWTYP